MTKDDLRQTVNKALESFLSEHIDECFEDMDSDEIYISTWDFFGDNPVFKHSTAEIRTRDGMPKRSLLTKHDRIRFDRAMLCDRNDIESLKDAILGLQSTDAPELVPLHDLLMSRLIELEKLEVKNAK